MLSLFISTFLKFFFLLTPFFVLSAFLAMTPEYTPKEKTALAIKVTLAVFLSAMIIFLVGNFVFQVFGITLDAFRIGTGVLLMLSAISLVRGKEEHPTDLEKTNIAVVPLAVPISVGPAVTGALLVMGAELKNIQEITISLAGITFAVLAVGMVLLSSRLIERVIKRQGIIVLSKITGLIIAAISAQLIMTGVCAFLKIQ